MGDDEIDPWMPARMAIVGKTPPDLKPMAEMLRSGEPISPGVRDMLAELLDPGDPDYLGLKLELVPTKTKRKIEDGIEHREIVKAFGDAMGTGRTAQEAAQEVGDQFGKSDRQVFRLRADWRKLVRRLRGER